MTNANPPVLGGVAPYLGVSNAGKAADFYVEAFGATEVMRMPGAFMLHLQVDDVDGWWKRAVDAGAEVVMPVSEMFWGDRYGQLRDPFGIKWSIATPIRKS